MRQLRLTICLLVISIHLAKANETFTGKPGRINAGDFNTLQEAFDAVPANGGLVKIPPGEYSIVQPLRITKEDIRIEGSGTSTHIINKNKYGEAAIVLEPEDYDQDNSKRVWRVQLADLRISGNESSGTGLLAKGVNEIYLHGLSIDHNGKHGIELVDCYEDPRVSDCILTYNKQAGLHILRGHDIVVNANQFEENLDAVQCIDSFNLCMNGNNLDDHLRHGVVIENTYGSVVSGNMIEECAGAAVILDRDCYGNTVSSNVIAHNGIGVDLRDAWGCAVSANTFTIMMGHSVVIGSESGRITLTGNNFSNSYIGGNIRREQNAKELGGGVVLDNTEDVTITGNIFTGLFEQALQTRGECERIVVLGNVFSDTSNQQKHGTDHMDMDEDENLIENNIYED